MTAMTLDLISGGRVLLGLGTSGPQVVEGWHGEPWGKPLGKTREYVEIVRAALAASQLEIDGEHYQMPYRGDGATGLGKPLKVMLRPLRATIPIYLASLRPKSVALAAEIADGWLPIFFSPERARKTFPEPFARDGLEIAPAVPAIVADDAELARDMLQAVLRALHRRHGRARLEFLQRPRLRVRLRGRGAADPGSLPRRQAARRGGGGARRARGRDGARRAARSGSASGSRPGGSRVRPRLLVSTRDVGTLRAIAELGA